MTESIVQPELMQLQLMTQICKLAAPQDLTAGSRQCRRVTYTYAQLLLQVLFKDVSEGCQREKMLGLTAPQDLAAGQQPMPPDDVCILHSASPAQHTVVRPGPQLLAAGQHALPLHATFGGQVCKAGGGGTDESQFRGPAFPCTQKVQAPADCKVECPAEPREHVQRAISPCRFSGSSSCYLEQLGVAFEPQCFWPLAHVVDTCAAPLCSCKIRLPEGRSSAKIPKLTAVPHILGGLHTPPTHVWPMGQQVRPQARATGQHVVPVHFCVPARQQYCRRHNRQSDIGPENKGNGAVRF